MDVARFGQAVLVYRIQLQALKRHEVSNPIAGYKSQ
jgi:hypothetical protein